MVLISHKYHCVYIPVSDMPSRKSSLERSHAPVVEESFKSLRPRRSSNYSNDASKKMDSPKKLKPLRIKLNKLPISNNSDESVKTKTPVKKQTKVKLDKVKVNFINEAEQSQTDFLIRDFRKMVTIRNAATTSLSSTADDEDEPDQEALMMLGKYGNASKLISGRATNDGKSNHTSTTGFGFKTPTKKGQMFEKTQEMLASLSSKKINGNLSTKSGSTLSSPNSSPTDKMIRKIMNTPTGNITPARRAMMNSTLVAHSPSGKKAHRNILTDINGTPEKLNRLREDENTPLKQLTLKASKDSPPTPHGLRRRVTRNLQKLNEQEMSESSESSSDEEEEDTVNERDSQVPMAIETKQSQCKPLSSQSQKEIHSNFKLKENTDLYFESHGKDGNIGERIHTSDNTLSRNLKTPLLSPEDLKSILDKENIQYQADINKLLVKHRLMFDRWLLWLGQEFNLVTYGLGSKRELLTNFHQLLNEKDPTAHVLVVNGYFPSLSLNHILKGIENDLLDGEDLKNKVVSKDENIEQCDIIFRLLEYLNDYIYLIVHNIDGLPLRADKIQATLAKLAAHKRVRLICSIDHVNAPLLWDADKRSKFNFVWYEATTFQPYTEETLNENSLILMSSANGGGSGGALALSSLSRVFESLTPNAKEIYLTIVKYQLEALEEVKKEQLSENSTNDQSQIQVTGTTYQGLSFKDLYRRCRRAFLVNSDLTLRAQLTEFRDHKLIKERKGFDDGIDYLIIPLNTMTLTEFLDQRNNMET